MCQGLRETRCKSRMFAETARFWSLEIKYQFSDSAYFRTTSLLIFRYFQHCAINTVLLNYISYNQSSQMYMQTITHLTIFFIVLISQVFVTLGRKIIKFWLTLCTAFLLLLLQN